jgi:branched-chain amino acid aminotransferase
VFLVKGDVLATPSLDEGILPGIMREAVIRLVRSLGGTVKEGRVRPADVLEADHVFLTNSLRFLRPVRKLDGTRFAVTSKLLDAIRQGLLQAEQEQIDLN